MQEDVAWVQVAMYDSKLVHLLDCAEQLPDQCFCLLFVKILFPDFRKFFFEIFYGWRSNFSLLGLTLAPNQT
jgi:hypothetical protein